MLASLLFLSMTVCHAETENVDEHKLAFWSKLEEDCDHAYGVIVKGAFTIAGISFAGLIVYGCIYAMINSFGNSAVTQPEH